MSDKRTPFQHLDSPFVYLPSDSNGKEAQRSILGVKFANDIFLSESFLKKRNIEYKESDLEQTPLGMCFRITKEKKEMIKEFPE
jgi:hypothetical protein